jgi:hypothetical protein
MNKMGKKISIKDVDKLEKSLNIILPKKYKEFLLKYNGGKPDPYNFDIPKRGDSALNYFFGIRGPKDYDLQELVERKIDRIPSNFIPIGVDSFGNNVCVGIKSNYVEKIYFWDHEKESTDENDNPTMDNMYFLANDIDEFIEKLYVINDE